MNNPIVLKQLFIKEDAPSFDSLKFSQIELDMYSERETVVDQADISFFYKSFHTKFEATVIDMKNGQRLMVRESFQYLKEMIFKSRESNAKDFLLLKNT